MVQAPDLKGRVIAITRAEDQARETADLIERMGGKPYVVPLLDFSLPEDLSQIRGFLEALRNGEVDCAIFMSVNAVRYLLKGAEVLGLRAGLREGLERAVVVAVGPRTAEELIEHGLPVDLIPEEYSSEGVARALRERGIGGKRVFVLRARGASPTLRGELERAGALVTEIRVYEARVPADLGRIRIFAEDLALGRIDAVIFGSPQSVRNFRRIMESLLGTEGLRRALSHPLLVAIGPETARALHESGLRVDLIPKAYTFREALRALAHHLSASSHVQARR